ncbi:TadE/TadG family type IV pilus assembly protein [Sphingomonas sp.]|uniref:TadE/TadG family type IV pilus assembly protein n=1 Tax=Sphingomonas sp. TaxID=28214 RepID=UPI0037503202
MIRLRQPAIARHERGAVIIELAIVAPVLALMAIGVVDLSNAYSRKLALEQGAQRAIEKIMQTTDYKTVEQTLTSEALCQVNGVNADGTCKSSPITASNVTSSYRLECSDSGGAMTTQTSTDVTAFDAYICPSGTTKESRYIQIALTDNYQAMFPVQFSGFSSGGYPISATAGMRTK